MNILFINPPNPFLQQAAMDIPLGIAYLSSFLKEYTEHKIQYLDYNLYQDNLYQDKFDFEQSNKWLQIIDLTQDYYCITGTTPQYFWLKKIALYIKKNRRDAIVIIGGNHASNFQDDVKRQCKADYVIKGEGEKQLFNIISGEYKIVDGLLQRNYINNLNILPFPDRTLTNYKLYKRTINKKRAFHLVTLRGCPYNCAFCDRNSVSRHTRYRSVDNVIQEIDFINGTYKVNSFVIYDDIFTLDKKRLDEFCKEFRKRNITWRCWSRTDLVDEDILKEMKQSGLSSITFGVESGDDQILATLNKGTTREINRKALLAAKKNKIPVRCSLIFGSPGETIFSLRNTIALIKETKPSEWNLSVLTPIPGSDIWNNPRKYKIRIKKAEIKANDYINCNRFGCTGVGEFTYDILGMDNN